MSPVPLRPNPVDRVIRGGRPAEVATSRRRSLRLHRRLRPVVLRVYAFFPFYLRMDRETGRLSVHVPPRSQEVDD